VLALFASCRDLLRIERHDRVRSQVRRRVERRGGAAEQRGPACERDLDPLLALDLQPRRTRGRLGVDK
jgi:hypothetical protein